MQTACCERINRVIVSNKAVSIFTVECKAKGNLLDPLGQRPCKDLHTRNASDAGARSIHLDFRKVQHLRGKLARKPESSACELWLECNKVRAFNGKAGRESSQSA